jgi:transposase InsO family protein
MINPQSLPHPAELALFRHSLDHVEREVAVLTLAAETSRQIRDAIGAGGMEGLTVALRLQDELARHNGDMRCQRQRWRNQVGAWLGIPSENVTLSSVASVLSGPAQRTLLDMRDRLRRQVQEVLRLNGANAFMVRAYLDVLQRFFLDLTGTGEASGRYAREGACPPPAYGSLLQVKG